jgi:hypothetical protein
MSKQSKRLTETVPPKKKRGRPATGNDPMMGFRMPVEFKAEIDAWAAAQTDKPPRSEAMRRLMKIGLASEPAPAKASTRAQPRRPGKRGVTGL